jgi:hypothetical protein
MHTMCHNRYYSHHLHHSLKPAVAKKLHFSVAMNEFLSL